MSEVYGLILADRSAQDLRELVAHRTSASLPFAGRYRLIDFALSSFQNAGVHDVGVIMQRSFQSLLDHLGSGKEWDMSRKRGGMRLLPPFGREELQPAEYCSINDALRAVEGYIRDVKQPYVCLTRGDLAANIDLKDVLERHLDSGADVTVVCSTDMKQDARHRFVADGNGFVTEIELRRDGGGRGYPSLETYIMSTERLLRIMQSCDSVGRRKFHRDGLGGVLAEGGRIAVYLYGGYSVRINSVDRYYHASMDMLKAEVRAQLFPPERPVRTKGRSDASTYYGVEAKSRNSLIADGCFIEGAVENCVLFRGVRVGRGSVLRNCVIMQDTVIGENVELVNVIADKDVTVSDYITLTGSPRLPLVLPKKSEI